MERGGGVVGERKIYSRGFIVAMVFMIFIYLLQISHILTWKV